MVQLVTLHRGRGSPRLPSRKRLYAMRYGDAITALCTLIGELREIDGAAGCVYDRKLERAKERLFEMEIGHPRKSEVAE